MDEQELEMIRGALRARVMQAEKEPEQALARLVAEGFYTKAGDLTPEYGGRKVAAG